MAFLVDMCLSAMQSACCMDLCLLRFFLPNITLSFYGNIVLTYFYYNLIITHHGRLPLALIAENQLPYPLHNVCQCVYSLFII